MIAYRDRESLLHSLDPRVKILIFAGFTASLAAFRTPGAAAAASLITIALFLFGDIRFSDFTRDARDVLFFSLLPLPVQAFTQPGEVVYSLGILSITREGLAFGAISSVFLINMIAVAMIFVYTTKPSKMVDALSWLRAPPPLSFSFALALQFIPVFYREVKEVRLAQSARGARLTSAMSVFPLIVPVIHRAFTRARELSISLDTRGFCPDRKREPHFRAGWLDYTFLLFSVAIFSMLALST